MYLNDEPSTPTKTFKEVANKAADLIEKRGHMIGGFYRNSLKNSPLCMMAALYEAEHSHRLTQMAGPFGVMGLKMEHYLGAGVCGFNNAHTKDEVVAALRSAANVVN